MATIVSYNGLSYTLPETGEENWGGVTKVDGFLVSLATNSLQKTGGNFTLSADVDWGGSAGHKATYYKTRTSNLASAGQFRLARADVISWRNQANGADLDLAVNSSNQLLFGGNVLLTGTGSLTASRMVVTDGTSALVTNSVTATEAGYLSGVSSAIQTQFGTLTTSVATKITASSSDTLTNKKLTDASCTFVDDGDATKQLAFQCSGITTATTRTWTVPDVSDTLVGLTANQTLTTKTLTSPTINTPTVNGQKIALSGKTTTYTALLTDDVLTLSGSLFTVTLPTAVGCTGKKYTFAKTSNDFVVYTIDGAGSETIGGNTTTTLNTYQETLQIVSDGTNWQITNRFIPYTWTAYTPTFGTGLGTCTNINVRWCRAGADLLVQGRFNFGTTVNNSANVSLPSGLAVASVINTNHLLGDTVTQSITNPAFTIKVISIGAAVVLSFGEISSNGGLTTTSNASSIFTTNQAISFWARVPIEGWNT